MEGLSHKVIIMTSNKELIIREGNIFFEEDI
jgi:hypothetical protein